MGRRHGRARIERLLRKRERHGLTYRELSEESGVPVGTLAWWSHRLERERAVRPPVSGELVEVEVIDDDEEGVGSAIEIVVGEGLRVRVPPTASETHLRRVLRAVASC